MNEVVATLEEISAPIDVRRGPVQIGDVRHTGANTSSEREAFGYVPPDSELRRGLEAMVAWAQEPKEGIPRRESRLAPPDSPVVSGEELPPNPPISRVKVSSRNLDQRGGWRKRVLCATGMDASRCVEVVG